MENLLPLFESVNSTQLSKIQMGFCLRGTGQRERTQPQAVG